VSLLLSFVSALLFCSYQPINPSLLQQKHSKHTLSFSCSLLLAAISIMGNCIGAKGLTEEEKQTNIVPAYGTTEKKADNASNGDIIISICIDNHLTSQYHKWEWIGDGLIKMNDPNDDAAPQGWTDDGHDNARILVPSVPFEWPTQEDGPQFICLLDDRSEMLNNQLYIISIGARTGTVKMLWQYKDKRNSNLLRS
jgi:hypothetical protein